MFFSPLEQFEIMPNFLLFYFSEAAVKESNTQVQMFFFFNNFDFSFFLSMFEIFIITFFFFQTKLIFPNFFSVSLNSFFDFGLSLLLSMVGFVVKRNLSLVLTFFVFILILNLLGLVPFGFCVTSQLIVTQFLGFFAIFGLTLKGFLKLKLKFFFLFLPKNVPLIMLPFLSFIEIVSYLSRMLSLSIRLFANMVAGHALLHILMGALLQIFNLYLFSFMIFIIFLLPTVLIFFILILEIGIAFLQAYVFVVLFLIYMKDSVYAH